jgi:H+-transporting ATPase
MSEPIVEKEAGPPQAVANNPGASTPPEEEKKKREYKDFEHDQEKATRE